MVTFKGELDFSETFFYYEVLKEERLIGHLHSNNCDESWRFYTTGVYQDELTQGDLRDIADKIADLQGKGQRSK